MDESTADSYDFLEMIDGILNDNRSNQIDYKLSNLVCENCFDLIENFNTFKQQSEKSCKLLQDAKVVLEAKITYAEIPLKNNVISLIVKLKYNQIDCSFCFRLYIWNLMPPTTIQILKRILRITVRNHFWNPMK